MRVVKCLAMSPNRGAPGCVGRGGGPALVASGGGAREHARGADSAFKRSKGRGHFYAFAVTGRARFGHKMGTGWAQRRFGAGRRGWSSPVCGE